MTVSQPEDNPNQQPKSNKIEPLELFDFTLRQLEHTAKAIKMIEDVMFKPKEPEFCSHCELDQEKEDNDE